MTTERVLFNLFDFQKFQGNSKLASVIAEADSRNGLRNKKAKLTEVSDEQLEYAAGGMSTGPGTTPGVSLSGLSAEENAGLRF